MNNRLSFYKKSISKYLNKRSKILVVGAGLNDYQVFKELGFKNVTFSSFSGDRINKINFKKIDINNINMQDKSYDYVVAHACIHHCSKPHAGILELYRVSKNGVLVIESRDSLLMKIMIYFKIAEEYEFSAITKDAEFGDYGGVDNSNIPNHVYRWTEREIKKLIKSYDPRYEHIIEFDYKYDYENIINKVNQKQIAKLFAFILSFFIKILDTTFKKQGNLFSFFIDKKKSKKYKFSWIN